MKSKIEFKLKSNGNLERQESKDDKLYQGQVGTAEYYLYVDKDWLATDIVLISFTRPDGKSSQQLTTRMQGGWVYTSNGWETDVAINEIAELKVSYVMRRYSLTQPDKLVATKTTEQITVPIYPSAGYTPLDIAESDTDMILQKLSGIELDKVDRVVVADIGSIPPQFIFAVNGKKTANVYYLISTLEYEVVDEETADSIKTYKTVKGTLFVTAQQGDEKLIQTETLTAEGRQWIRKVEIDGEEIVVGEFEPLGKGIVGKQGKQGLPGDISQINFSVESISYDEPASAEQEGDDVLLKLPRGEPGLVSVANGIYGFTVEDGNLMLYYQDETPPPFKINENGELIYVLKGDDDEED